MFDDDEWDDELEDITTLLARFDQLKEGELSPYLFSFDDFEQIIDFYLDESSYKKALETVDYAMSIYPNSLELYIHKTDVLMACDKNKEALQAVRAAKKIDEKNLELVSLEVEVLCALNKEEEAIYLLEKRIEAEEQDFTKIFLQQELVTIFVLKEDFKKAFHILNDILNMDNNNEEALHRYPYIAYRADKAKDSIEMHIKFLENKPLDELLWYNLADAYLKDGQLSKAQESFDVVIGLDTKNDAAFMGLTETYIKQKKYDAAIATIEEYTRLGEMDYFMLSTLARCYEYKKNFAKAREIYRSLSVHFDFVRDKIVLVQIAQTYIMEEAYTHAISTLKEAESYDKADSEISYLLAKAYAAQENYPDAVAYIDKAIRQSDGHTIYEDAKLAILYAADAFEEVLYFCAEILAERSSPSAYYYKVAANIQIGSLQEAELALHDALTEHPKQNKLVYDMVENFETYYHLNSIISSYID